MDLFGLRFFLIVFVILEGNTLIAQQLNFDILLNEEVIGIIDVDRSTNGALEQYEIISEVNFKVLWRKYERETRNTIAYENGILSKSFNSVYMNNKMEDSSALVYKSGKYHGYRSPDDHFSLEHIGVNFSMIKLYYKEPLGLKEVYSERYLEMCPIESVAPHKYKVYIPNGKHNYYTYKNGQMVEALIDRTWFNLTFRPKK